MRTTGVLAVAALAVAAVWTVSCSPPVDGGVRVVLITLDTLRQDAFLGGERRAGRMPRLGAWSEKGRVFERYYSSTSTTQPSHASLLTGLHPWEHGVSRNGLALAEERVTVAERLKDAGFTTAAAVAAFPLHRSFGFQQGFETYHDTFTAGNVERWKKEVPDSHFRSPGEDVTRAALDLLAKARGPKQFFWFHYFDAHSPYGGSTGSTANLNATKVMARIRGSAAAEDVLARARELYDRDVGYLDDNVDRVLVRLREDEERLGIETHVVVVSDHGESFGEGGSVGHGKRLTPEQIVVPCFVLSPRVAPGVSQEPVGTVDMTATLLSLAGLDKGGARGRDLLEPGERSTPIVGMRRTFEYAFKEARIDGTVHVHDGLRFYVLEGEDLITGSSEGPLTRNDSSEEVKDPDRVALARRLFASFEERLGTQEALARDDDETLEKLEALGYVR